MGRGRANTGDQTLAGLGGIAHSLATAVNDFLVASGAGAFVKKTLADTDTLRTPAAFMPCPPTASPTAIPTITPAGMGRRSTTPGYRTSAPTPMPRWTRLLPTSIPAGSPTATPGCRSRRPASKSSERTCAPLSGGREIIVLQLDGEIFLRHRRGHVRRGYAGDRDRRHGLQPGHATITCPFTATRASPGGFPQLVHLLRHLVDQPDAADIGNGTITGIFSIAGRTLKAADHCHPGHHRPLSARRRNFTLPVTNGSNSTCLWTHRGPWRLELSGRAGVQRQRLSILVATGMSLIVSRLMEASRPLRRLPGAPGM